MSHEIRLNLKEIQKRIDAAALACGRNPEEILLIAVGKTKPVEALDEAYRCGQLHFGENRARELEEKMKLLDRDEIRWHYVGPIQTNKIKYIAGRVDWIHSVYKTKYFAEIEKRAEASGRVIDTLIQVNISDEEQKQGCRPEEVAGLIDFARPLKNIRVRGLMGMATHTDDTDRIRKEFRLLRRTLESHRQFGGGSVKLEHLSMGMSNDLEIAVEEGSTMLRIGSSIFGEREYG